MVMKFPFYENFFVHIFNMFFDGFLIIRGVCWINFWILRKIDLYQEKL